MAICMVPELKSYSAPKISVVEPATGKIWNAALIARFKQECGEKKKFLTSQIEMEKPWMNFT